MPVAGHSKWKQIKRKKAVTDQKRGAMFTRLIREITIAAKAGGGDPGGNARLRTAIDAAKADNMPAENIDRAIKKGTGELEGVTYEEVTYEGYGPGGAALLVQATTDNPNRTVAEIRNIFGKLGGNLGASNSVAWMFDRKGLIVIDGKANEDVTMEVALDAGADDMEREGDIYVITTPPVQLHAIDQALRAKKLPVQTAEISMVPKNTVKVEGGEAKRLLALVESLEELDDVAKVFSNFDIDAEAMAAVTG
jgi:YebC/PmpR family DNA-binding regulatory protein